MIDTDKKVAPDALTMSDEDFLNMDPSEFEEPVPPTEDDTDSNLTLDSDDGLDESAGQEEDDDSQSDDDGQKDEDKSGDNSDADHFPDDEAASAAEAARREALSDEERAAEDASNAADNDGDESNEDITKHSDGLSDAEYNDIGKRVMAEFKANGKTMKMKSPEDVLQLMQMGANYHKKMSGMKPALKTLKLLENHGLLDETKLNYLIDLHQKKPEAITQLLKDSKIDPMQIDLAGDNDYVPATRAVNDTEIALDQVLDDISQSPSYSETLNVIGETWDDASRESISSDPEVIRTINQHMDAGIFSQVADAVAYERQMGKLVGVNDLDAYRQVGSYMYENKLLKSTDVAQNSGNESAQLQQSNQSSESDANKQERTNRKRAASPSRQKKVSPKGKKEYSPLEMSDEEFAKLNSLDI